MHADTLSRLLEFMIHMHVYIHSTFDISDILSLYQRPVQSCLLTASRNTAQLSSVSIAVACRNYIITRHTSLYISLVTDFSSNL